MTINPLKQSERLKVEDSQLGSGIHQDLTIAISPIKSAKMLDIRLSHVQLGDQLMLLRPPAVCRAVHAKLLFKTRYVDHIGCTRMANRTFTNRFIERME